MPRRARATSVSWSSRDETGAIMSIEFDCPYCHFPSGELIYIGPTGVDSVDSPHGFETDQVCGICDKPVIVEVPASLY